MVLSGPRWMPGTREEPGWRQRAVGEQAYLIRYGIMGHVGRFRAWPEWDAPLPLERSQVVVIQTDRGIELGEVLIRVDESATPDRSRQEGPAAGPDADADEPGMADRPRVLRLAGPEDLA